VYGREDKTTVTGRTSDLSIALSGGSNQSKLHFPINSNRAGPGGRMRAGTRRLSQCHVSIGWANLCQKKIMPDDEYYTNPAGLFDWCHGVPVRATVYLQRKMIFFFVRCSHQIRLFHIPQMVVRFLRCSQNLRLLIMGYLSTPRGSDSAVNLISMRSHPAGASLQPDSLIPSALPGRSMMQ
jgi:hypothetical protein